MLNKSGILNDKVFRRYIYAYVITQINLWMIPILTPILLNKRIGIGQEFALTLGLQWLPSILMGPITGFLLKKWGPHKIYIAVMCIYPIIIFLFPVATNLFQLQLIILGLGIGQAVSSPCSLTLRAYVMPEGKEVAGNSIIVGTQRLSKSNWSTYSWDPCSNIQCRNFFCDSCIILYTFNYCFDGDTDKISETRSHCQKETTKEHKNNNSGMSLNSYLAID